MIKKKDSTLRYSNCKRYSVAAGLKERMSWRWRCGCWLVLLWFLLFIFSPSARPCCILPHPFGLWSSSPCFPSWLCWDENGCCCCGVRGRLVLREAAGSGGENLVVLGGSRRCLTVVRKVAVCFQTVEGESRERGYRSSLPLCFPPLTAIPFVQNFPPPLVFQPSPLFKKTLPLVN
jgi:hypothetical protein